jgi:hypothetical protein
LPESCIRLELSELSLFESAQRIELSVLVFVRVLVRLRVFPDCEVLVEVFVELFDESLVEVFPESDVLVELFEESLVEVFPELLVEVLPESFVELSVFVVVVVFVVVPGSATCAMALVDKTAATAKAEAEARNLKVIDSPPGAVRWEALPPHPRTGACSELFGTRFRDGRRAAAPDGAQWAGARLDAGPPASKCSARISRALFTRLLMVPTGQSQSSAASP